MGYEPHLTPRTVGLVTQYLALELYVGHIAVNLVNIVEATAVDILVGKVIQQIMHGTDAQFLRQEGCPLWTHTLKILYVARREVVHNFSKTKVRQLWQKRK